jgi:two-component system NtrC family sensor kinase
VDLFGDDQSSNELIQAALTRKEPVATTSLVAADDLRKESPLLAEKAYLEFIDTPKARARVETEETKGMMLTAAAPIFDYENNLIGVLYGGVLLNRNFEIVDKTKETVFQEVKYKGKDIGTATIFQDDVRISTNVKNEDGSRAIGTRVSEDVYRQVVEKGEVWIGRAYVVNDWYITAYEPIKDINRKIIGILYVGILEQRYVDIERRTVLVFLTIALMGALVSMGLSYFFSRTISISINELVSASHEVAQGNLDTRVEVTSNDELHELADSFNMMASALQKRDKQLKEFARSKIMESERLAIVGQLAAGVAHEINNPLQGIVTYAHLLLEKMPTEDTKRNSIEKIVNQADRCRNIIRGLLDFARQRKPHKILSNINPILQECISLIETQAIFHNIEILKDFEDNLPKTLIDPAQMQQVFINMIINAAEAIEGNGRLMIATSYDAPGEFIRVRFTDTGHGIKQQDLEQIFDPFFTTKEVGHGTGLGLAISFGIVKEHGGTISVDSKAGEGTTFTVRLPAVTQEVVVNAE